MGWTEQQQKAIDARDTSLIVSAAAGSGKTAVLTERLVQLLADRDSGVRADRMVVVTFTNDAASELKKRLDSKLRAMINESPDDRHLLKQQILLQSARISTINSFCFDLIRDNIGENGVTSGFSVLDDTDNKVLRARAMEELINYYCENEYEKISFMYDHFCIKDEKRLVEVLERADSFLSSVALRDKWLENAVSMYSEDFERSVYYESFFASVTEELNKAVRAADDNIGMIKRIFPDMSAAAAEKSYAQAEDDYDRISAIADIFRSRRFPTAEEAEQAQAFSALVRTGKTPHDKALREIYKKKRDLIKKTAEKVLSSISSVKSDYRECREVTKVLAEMLKKFGELLWEKKCEKNALSFDDGERLALEILAAEDESGMIIQSETAERIAEYYDIIMIDEYQDSNNKQDLIFKLISKNYRHDETGEPLYGDNVFLVGDVKQSIYRFRLANPRNFINTLRVSEPYSEDNTSKNQAIVLNKNFRSSPQVIDFVNFVFSQIMSEKCGDINYTEDEMLYFGASQYTENEAANRKACISFINDDAPEDDEQTEKVNREAVYTASKIAEMLANGVRVTDKDGSERPCKPSDFCILVRNNAHINMYADELNRKGMPAKGSEESGYLKSREIAVLIDLLRIISNPLQDVSMAAVMTSPMYMFSISDIAAIKSYDRKKPLFPVIRGIADGEYAECEDMFLMESCREFLESLDRFRLDSVTMTIGELIGEIYDTTDFISVMELYNDGDKKRANLRALIQYAQNYENTAAFDGSGGLNGFLRHLDRVMENGDYAQGKVSASAGDYVSVMTLHRSKGLEFPFVFIAETSVNFKFDSKPVMCSQDGRIGYVLYDPTLLRKYKTFQQVMLAGEEERDTRSEEMRLLYVGLTRAQQKLFINLKCGEKALKRVSTLIDSVILQNGDIYEAVSEAKSFSDWMWLSVLRTPCFDEIAEKIGIDTGSMLPYVNKDMVGLFEYETVSGISPEEAEQKEVSEESAPDEMMIDNMKDIISFSYDRTLSETPAKLSVTQITKKLKDGEEPFDMKLKRPRFRSESSKLTGAERGTAIHTFFQYCDFDRAINNVGAEIASVTEKGYISKAEAESIDRDNVSAFFRGELYKRICSAKEYVREKKFMVAVSELDIDNEALDKLKKSDGMIKGIIDLMFEEADGIVIVDYKSDRGVSLEKLKERYSMQLKLYKAAIELTTKKNVKEAYLYSFEKQDHIAVDI